MQQHLLQPLQPDPSAYQQQFHMIVQLWGLEAKKGKEA
jgi:hypothetical protein